jgi:hypothetical protein
MERNAMRERMEKYPKMAREIEELKTENRGAIHQLLNIIL